MSNSNPTTTEAVAIVGLAGRFPRAQTAADFWRRLRDGTECISFFRDEEVQWLPIEHPPVANDPRYVRARGVLERPEWFDAGFFGLNPREAAIMDPQHRVFLECAWEALEDAGCNPDCHPGLIGVFAGASMNTYLFTNLLTNPELVKDYGLFSSMIMNDGDFVPTRVSYKLNLRGPSINVQTACSTSLVAVCLAAQSLLTYRCDAALAGGVSITFPAFRGQHHLEGGIMSNDGHCRAFDAKASGTVLGDGAGVVVLKRLSEAVAEGDRIYAVIKGTAINNDGAVKIGYTAPSADGQAECIAMAHAEAGVEPETISYVEAHGTGTPLGDPIEIAGLAKAFGIKTGAAKSCAVGSVKSNIGHLDIAAGVAGLIKTALAFEHEEIPPSLHFESVNPKLELERTPFFINGALRPWPRSNEPRRAGVSSFGIGGTNAHVVLEEPPRREAGARSARKHHLLVVSARTPSALEQASANLAARLETDPSADLADIAFSLQTRRKAFGHRRAVVADSRETAVEALRESAAVTPHGDETPTVAFLYPGQGAQAIGMGRELLLTEPTFRADVDHCAERLRPALGLDLRRILYPTEPGAQEEATGLLTQTRITQPALFVVEYALARLWMRYGVVPNAMIGHSLGEYVAACVAGVFSLEDALAIVAERARLMQAQPGGAMIAVRLSEEQVAEFLSSTLSLAATNSRGLCVVSGPFDAITALETKLGESDVASRRLATSHAFHSAMMDPVIRPLAEFIRSRPRQAPQIPFVSNVSGTWITSREATDPEYWASHVRQTVRFSQGAAQLMEPGSRRVLIEVGPGQTLAGLVRRLGPGVGNTSVIASLPETGAGCDDRNFLAALGKAWSAGVAVDWKKMYEGERRLFVALPTYPFERKRYWIEPGIRFQPAENARTSPTGIDGPFQPASSDPAKAESGRSRELAETVSAGCGSTDSIIEQLRQLFAELSGIEPETLEPKATFYELGFDSLFLTQASTAVSRRMGVDVTFQQLREDLRSLVHLAAYVEDRKARSAGVSPAAAGSTSAGSHPITVSPAPGLVPGPEADATERVVPLTTTQRELWFASQLGAEVSSAYNESSNIRLEGPLDLAALERAFGRLVARHEALRTTIVPGGEAQRIAARIEARLPVRDFASLAEEERERRVCAFIAEELERPFDLTKGPLFRMHLLRLAPERHIVFTVVHHIICDGWSLGILQQDLANLYTEESAGGSSPVATPPPPSFADYAVRQSQGRDQPEYRAAAEYWRRHFADGVPVFDLPSDRPRPSVRNYAGAFRLHVLPADLTEGLKRLCTRYDCTLFTTLLAAYALLLHRLSGQDDLVVGVPAAAQVMDGIEDLVGHFANLLPIRSRAVDNPRFSEFLLETRRALSAALQHWRYPFGELLQQLNLARDSSRMPLANVVFNSTRLRGTLRFGAMAATIEGNAKRFSHFDLNLNFAVTNQAISLGAYYSTELFDDATVQRWLGHFETLLRAIAADPESGIRRLPLLTEAERVQVLHRWNDRSLDYDRGATIAGMFERQARRTPETTAVVAGSERITYRELDERAERLAVRLREAGVGADTLVGIFLTRSPALLVAVLGILKAGGAYVPLDPKHPTERLEFIVGDTVMPMVVSERRLVEQLPAGGFDFLVLDDESPGASRIGRALTTPNRKPATPESLAYVLYTSGSTGRPKGVAMPQGSVAALVAWARDCYEPRELDGVLFSTSASFDISVFEIFCPLCLGGRIVMTEDLLAAAALPAEADARFLSGVPSAVAELVRLKGVPTTVTTVALAGETFPQPLVDALYALPHVRRVFELYGPTETTVYSTGGLRTPNSRPSLGRPFPNEQIYILDRWLEPVPVGVPGEICIGGAKLARGYLNRPDLTDEKFIPNPWDRDAAHGPGASRLYRSGDLGRWRPDGTIESLGRMDHQVKIRGFRVELGEVEAALGRHPQVAEGVVIVRPDPAGNNRLLAYAVPRSGLILDGREVRDHLRKLLPEYMVPSIVTVLERCPRTSTGKLDRKALPLPDDIGGGDPAGAPATTTEELLASIWRDVLGLSRVGVHDNFFEVGGHSLLAAQVIARVHDVLEVEMTIRQFFDAPTIAGFAGAVEAALISEIKAERPDAAPSDAMVTAEEGA